MFRRNAGQCLPGLLITPRVELPELIGKVALRLLASSDAFPEQIGHRNKKWADH